MQCKRDDVGVLGRGAQLGVVVMVLVCLFRRPGTAAAAAAAGVHRRERQRGWSPAAPATVSATAAAVP